MPNANTPQSAVKSIEHAMKLVDAKKENLREAYENMRSHSSQSPLNFSWADLDSYITSYQVYLNQSLSTVRSQIQAPANPNPKSELKSKEEPVPKSELKSKEEPVPKSELKSKEEPVPKSERKSKEEPAPTEVPARPELKSFCEKNDGLGLREYIIERPNDRGSIRVELADAFKHSPDAGSMVLDALDGFWEVGANDSRVRRACVVLLEEFMATGLETSQECRSRAASNAIEWKGKIFGGDNSQSGGNGIGDEGLERLAFLHFLVAYKLLGDGGVCSTDDVVDCVVEVSKFRQAMHLVRRLGIQDRVSDIVKKLIDESKQLLALKFILEFEITDGFSPVALLNDYLSDSKKNSQASKNGENSSKPVIGNKLREINALRSVIKFIEEHDLESQYPKGELLTQLEKLENEKFNKKRPTGNQLNKGKSHPWQPKQNGNKRFRAPSGSSGPRGRSFHARPPFSQRPAVTRATNLLPNYIPPTYLGSTHGAYGHHVGPDPYGSTGGHAGYYASPSQLPPVPHPHASELHAQQPVVYYGESGAVSYGGSEVAASQYHHTPYYPQ